MKEFFDGAIKVAQNGIKVDRKGYDRFGKALDGVEGACRVMRRAHAEMAPDDDTPLQLTTMEGVFILMEQLGVELGN